MTSKCPPGVICIGNITLFILAVIVLVICYLFYMIMMRWNLKNEKYVLNINENQTGNSNNQGLYPRPGYTFSNVRDDVLLNPYEPPVRDDRVFQGPTNTPNKIPINIETQSFDSNYRQIGILTRIGGTKETILPLMGRPLIVNRDKWNFYTLSESNNLLKLPISHKNRKCMSQIGCDNLYTGDTVHVDGYNDSFKVTTYESNTLKYIPYI